MFNFVFSSFSIICWWNEVAQNKYNLLLTELQIFLCNFNTAGLVYIYSFYHKDNAEVCSTFIGSTRFHGLRNYIPSNGESQYFILTNYFAATSLYVTFHYFNSIKSVIFVRIGWLMNKRMYSGLDWKCRTEKWWTLCEYYVKQKHSNHRRNFVCEPWMW